MAATLGVTPGDLLPEFGPKKSELGSVHFPSNRAKTPEDVAINQVFWEKILDQESEEHIYLMFFEECLAFQRRYALHVEDLFGQQSESKLGDHANVRAAVLLARRFWAEALRDPEEVSVADRALSALGRHKESLERFLQVKLLSDPRGRSD